MLTTGLFSTHLEWPAPGARVAGPVVWLRGWVVGHAGCDFVDVRARTASGVFLGVLGLPRTDLAAHFAPTRRWLPAEFIVAVAAADGDCHIELEAQDQHGRWHALPSLAVTVAPDGAASPRVEGKFLPHPGGGSAERVPHLPLHGHLDDPEDGAAIRDGVLPVFGWFVHDEQRVARVSATFDTRTFSVLASGLTDDALAQKVPHLPAARHGRVRGTVPYFSTYADRACLRVYVELSDGSVQLALARRLAPCAESAPPPTATRALPQAMLPAHPSGRPRRLLVVLRTLRPNDATLRALDVVSWLAASGRWVARAVAAEDGPLDPRFDAAGCSVQQLDLRALTAAQGAAAEAELARLDRTIWWRHLDALALFDETTDWIIPLARRHGLPVFRDPADLLAWHPPTERLLFDAAAPARAPIRGQARHGGWTLLASGIENPRGTPVVLTDLREDEDEQLLRDSLCAVPTVRAEAETTACSALICPAWRDHPLRTLLAAAVSGVPVITTPAAPLATTFSHGEFALVPPGNPLALAHALADLQANPAAAQRRAEAARRVATAHHDPAVLLPRWCAALEATVIASR